MNPRMLMRKIRLPVQAALGGANPVPQVRDGPKGEYFTGFVKYSG